MRTKSFEIIFWDGNDTPILGEGRTVKAPTYADAVAIARDEMDKVAGAVDYTLLETTPRKA